MVECAVIIPTCDRPASVRLSVASALEALAQAGGGTVVVVDDGTRFSAQQSLSEITSPDLKIVVNRGLRGPSAARNVGASQVQANLLFFLDDDDLMVPDYIKRVLSERRVGTCMSVWGFFRISDSASHPAVVKMLNGRTLDCDTPLQQRLAATSSGFWIERVTFLRLGGLTENLRVNEDTDFCLTLATAGLLPWCEPRRGVNKNAARSLSDSDKLSITKSARAAERAAAWRYILEKHRTLLVSHPMEQAAFAANASKFLARSGDLRGAIKLALSQKGKARWRALLLAVTGAVTRRQPIA